MRILKLEEDGEVDADNSTSLTIRVTGGIGRDPEGYSLYIYLSDETWLDVLNTRHMIMPELSSGLDSVLEHIVEKRSTEE